MLVDGLSLTSAGAVDSIHRETFVARAFRSLLLLVLTGTLAGGSLAGCSPLGPSSPPEVLPNANLVVENFSGTLPVKGFRYYSFSVVESGLTYLSLISLKEAGVDSSVLVTIGLGTPRGTTCPTNSVLSVKADGLLSLTATTARGVHCAVIFDPGNLTNDATFSLNIAHPK
jgi:hypothetical protein